MRHRSLFRGRPTADKADSHVVLRPIVDLDLGPVADLFDAALGEGYWSLDLRARGSHALASLDGAIVGAASAALLEGVEELPDLPGPVGLIRLVAVAPSARGRGVATRLVDHVSGECAQHGANSLAAFAWVHGDSQVAPLAGILQRAGFTCERRLQGFYARRVDGVCRACGASPCVCAADLYIRRPRREHNIEGTLPTDRRGQ